MKNKTTPTKRALFTPKCAQNTDIRSKAQNDYASKKKSKTSFCSLSVLDVSSEVLEQVWGHYRAYLDSEEGIEDEEEVADIDELYEIVHILEQYVDDRRVKDEQFASFEVQALPEFHLSVESFDRIQSLVPALLSVVHLHVGNHLISQGFENNDEKEDITSDDGACDILMHLNKSINYFPFNASTLSILANFKRMKKKENHETICYFYECASRNANLLRDLGLKILSNDNDHFKDDVTLYKEWVELLFLDGMCGVEYIGDDHDDDGGDNDDVKNCDDENNNSVDEYSVSDVESVASFMSALLNSTLGNHDKAMIYLKKFQLSHRIHPNVWSFSMDKSLKNNELKGKVTDTDSSNMTFMPKIFHGNVLPQELYKKLCCVFKPSSAYWKESNYQNRGYYSFFNDLDKNTMKHPKNLIEDVVANYLLPIVKQEIPKKANEIVGFEWWTHTRPLSANLGHQLHFDTDEAFLDLEKEVTHPIVSSVLYLTGNKDSNQTMAGSTIVFNQTPDSKKEATKAYISHAHDNSFMIFPGNCLHGVLPCPGSKTMEETVSAERLTLMVGFWTRCVPDNIKEKILYSPCGPLPPNNDDHTWVKDISSDYDGRSKGLKYEIDSRKLEGKILPAIEPAWDKIDSKMEANCKSSLQIPCSLDHRFFVNGAPGCFRDSLFKSGDTF